MTSLVLHTPRDDVRKTFGKDFTTIVVDETEAVSVVRRGKIVPHAVRRLMLDEQPDHVRHVGFTPFDFRMADGAELAAPHDSFGMLRLILEDRSQMVFQKLDVHARIVRIGVLRAVDDTLEIAVAFDIVAWIRHVAIVVQLRGLQHAALMRELAQRTDVTVAQFAQAIGSIYFAFS